MAKGNPQLATRITPEFLAWVEKQIESLNYHQSRRNDEPWDMARFIRAAIVEKLKKMQRSRDWHKKSRGRCQAPPAVQGIEETDKCTSGADGVQGESVRQSVASPEFS